MTGSTRTPRRTALTLALAAGGVALGHAVAYIAVAPGGRHRAQLLTETGHALWHAAAWVAVVAAAGAAVAHLARQLRHGHRNERPDDHHGLALRLAAVQTLAFVAMEVVERLDAGASLGSMLHRNLLVVGLAVQVLVAVLLAWVLGHLGRAAAAIGRRLAGRRPRPARTPRCEQSPVVVLAGRLPVALWPSRAPPVPS